MGKTSVTPQSWLDMANAFQGPQLQREKLDETQRAHRANELLRLEAQRKGDIEAGTEAGKELFESGVGLKYEPETAPFAEQFMAEGRRGVAEKRAAQTAATLKALEPKKRQGLFNFGGTPQPYSGQSEELYQQSLKGPSGKSYDIERLGPETQARIADLNERTLKAAGVIGEENREKRPDMFNESIHNMFKEGAWRPVKPGTEIDVAKGIQGYREAGGKAVEAIGKGERETINARIDKETEQDRLLEIQARSTKGIHDGYIAQIRAKDEPRRIQHEQVMAQLDQKLREAQVAGIPDEVKKRQLEIGKLQDEEKKRQLDFDKEAKLSKLYTMWSQETDPQRQEKIGQDILVLNGKVDKVLEMDATQKQRYIENRKDAVRLLGVASEARHKATLSKDDPDQMMTHLDAANQAMIESSVLLRNDKVWIDSGKRVTGYFGGESVKIDKIQVPVAYARNRRNGFNTKVLTQALPSQGSEEAKSMTPKELKDRTGLKAMVLRYSILENNPDLAKKPNDYLMAVDSAPGIEPEVKELTKHMIKEGLNTQQADLVTEVAATTLKPTTGLAESRMDVPGEPGSAKIGRAWNEPVVSPSLPTPTQPTDPRKLRQLPGASKTVIPKGQVEEPKIEQPAKEAPPVARPTATLKPTPKIAAPASPKAEEPDMREQPTQDLAKNSKTITNFTDAIQKVYDDPDSADKDSFEWYVVDYLKRRNFRPEQLTPAITNALYPNWNKKSKK